jgi:DNA polymerase I
MSFDCLPFRELWAIDFEFGGGPGDRQVPRCLVGRELRSHRYIRVWEGEFGPYPSYPIDDGSLIIAYYASAEFACHAALNWPMPSRIFDCFTEFRALLNGFSRSGGNGLLDALVRFGIDHVSAAEKSEMRDLAMRGGPWTLEEKIALLAYCQGDVDALAALFPALLPYILNR